MRRYSMVSVVVLMVSAFVVGLIVASNLGLSPMSRATDESAASVSPAPGAMQAGVAGEESLSIFTFRRVAELRKPSVVNISTRKVIKPREMMQQDPRQQGDMFFEFFGQDFFQFFLPREYTQQSLGSGVIVDGEGYILTNNHVIEDADEIIVKLLDDETEYDATVVGRDPKTDLALVKISGAKNLHVAELGDSDALHVGDWVIAIGNPFGWSHTVTVGVVSALDRAIGQGPYDQYIQTDASINPGNSGGPLFDISGKVVGINTAIATRTGGYQGIGFTIPVNMARKILPQLKEKGEVSRGWIGVTIQRIDNELARKFGLSEAKGALVNSVVVGSPADKAGIKQGDIIISFNNKKIGSFNDLSKVVADTAIDSTADVVINRDGTEKKLRIKIGLYPKDEDALVMTGRTSAFGLELQELTPQLGIRLSIPPDTSGVIISSILPGSSAEKAGLQRGDVIVSIERTPSSTVDEAYRLLGQVKSGGTALLLIQRGSQSLFITMKNTQ